MSITDANVDNMQLVQQTAVVGGIERFCTPFSANGIECDSCGVVVTPPNFNLYRGGCSLDRVQKAAIQELNWESNGQLDLCPRCK